MKLYEIGKKIADLLYANGKGTITFDWKTYDNNEDIPCLKVFDWSYVDGKPNRKPTKYDEYKVVTFYINEDGTEVTITTIRDNQWWDYTFYLDFRVDEDNEFADNEDDYERILEEMGVYELLLNVYYETDAGYEIGDFEMDFLKI